MDPVLGRFLRSLSHAGVRRIPRARPAHAPTAAGPAPARATSSSSPAVLAPSARDAGPPPSEPRSGGEPAGAADPEAALAAVAGEVAACARCKLASSRTRPVPGEGSARARVVFVGEGPGADEDRTGRPFVGRAGQLLDDIIVKGMGLRRQDVFICNVVKCRPPGNRVPEPDEVAACGDFLDRQLDALAPAVVCALGTVAARRLLATELPMSRLRGGTYSYRGIPVIPTYHPAYLLRTPAAKRATWEDIQRVMDIAGLR